MQKGLFEKKDFRKDHSMFAVYYYLLEMANMNTENKAQCTVGVRQVARDCRLTSAKAYRIMKKLEALEIVKREVKHDFTCCTIIYNEYRNAKSSNIRSSSNPG